MTFAKGQSGNPSGRAKEKPFRDALRLELAAVGEDHAGLRRVVRGVIAKAEAGDVQAANLIADRIDGKVAQPVVGDDTEPPIQVQQIERRIVDAGQNTNNPDSESLPPATGAGAV